MQATIVGLVVVHGKPPRAVRLAAILRISDGPWQQCVMRRSNNSRGEETCGVREKTWRRGPTSSDFAGLTVGSIIFGLHTWRQSP